jgi:hypothetical protein
LKPETERVVMSPLMPARVRSLDVFGLVEPLGVHHEIVVPFGAFFFI